MTPGEPAITSTSNTRVKAWGALKTTKGRRATGVFLAEGPNLVEEALRSPIRIEELITTPAGTEKFPGLLRAGAAVSHTTVKDHVMRSFCDSTSPQDIAAVCRIPDPPALPDAPGRFLVLDGVQDPGNVGNMVRTAEAAGIDLVFFGAGCADPWNPKTVRGSQGSLFRVPIIQMETFEAIGALRTAGTRIIASAMEGSDYRTAPRGEPFGLVIGSEGSGLDPIILDASDIVVCLPMKGQLDSLSAPIAGALLMYYLAGM